jgi:hypothetical protein
VFTARYALSPYIKQTRFVFKGLNWKYDGWMYWRSGPGTICRSADYTKFLLFIQVHGHAAHLNNLPFTQFVTSFAKLCSVFISQSRGCLLFHNLFSQYVKVCPSSHLLWKLISFAIECLLEFAFFASGSIAGRFHVLYALNISSKFMHIEGFVCGTRHHMPENCTLNKHTLL